VEDHCDEENGREGIKRTENEVGYRRKVSKELG